jgi:hypothetical protein
MTRRDRIKYINPQQNWRRIKPHLKEPVVRSTLTRDFNKFVYGRWGQEFTDEMVPADFESCDWRCGRIRRGPEPAYWQYVKHSACHWLVNFNLRLAERVEPKRLWRILTSDDHSTVWDGDHTLFDFNYCALGVPPDEAYAAAAKGSNACVLPPGVELEVNLAHSVDVELFTSALKRALRMTRDGVFKALQDGTIKNDLRKGEIFWDVVKAEASKGNAVARTILKNFQEVKSERSNGGAG